MRVDRMVMKRLGVSALAAVTVGAAIPAFTASLASADVGTRISITPSSQTGAAGSCLPYTVRITDAFGNAATDTGTVTVTLTENPNTATQDVDFCVPSSGGSAFATGPSYTNAGLPGTPGTPPTCGTGPLPPCPPGPGGSQTYSAGPSVTSPPSSSSGTGSSANNPDSSETAAPANNTSTNNSNPLGTDSASFMYGTVANPGNTITFGVAGLVQGGANITASAVNSRNETATGGSTPGSAASATASFSDGGRPGSIEAANAARTLEVSPNPSFAPIASPTHTFKVVVKNSNGNTLFGVVPSYVVTAGPGTRTTNTDCPATDSSGASTCLYPAPAPGTDQLLFYVNQTTGSSPTSGPDPGEPRTSATAITTQPPVAPSQAFTIDLTPDTASTPAGSTRKFTAFVTSSSGAPAQGVDITFVESGPGTFQGSTDANGTSVASGTTDSTGRAIVTVLTTAGQTGTETITATISNPSGTSCQSTGGRCSDTSTHTITAGASPSPSASASASPSASPSRSSSPTASPTGSPTRAGLSLSTNTPLIPAGSTARLTATGAANQAYELRCYTRPSTTYVTARSGSFDASATPVPFTLSLGRNTRCFIQYATNPGQGFSGSVVINVRTVLSLSTVRTAVRTYLFQGRNLPRVAGQLITLYRVDSSGSEIRTSNLTTDDSGIYRVTRQFTGSGTFQFKVRTSQTLNNAAGVSNTITVKVY